MFIPMEVCAIWFEEHPYISIICRKCLEDLKMITLNFTQTNVNYFILGGIPRSYNLCRSHIEGS